MRIVHVIATLAAGGAETFVADLAEAQALRGEDVVVFLLCGAQDTRGAHMVARLSAAHVSVVSSNRKPRDPRNFIDLCLLLLRFKPDVIHAHLYAAEAVALAAATILGRRRRTFRTLHSVEYRNGTNALFMRIAARGFGMTICCARAVAESYRVKDRRQSSSNHDVIENGIRLSSSWKGSASFTTDKAFRLLMVGAFRGGSLKQAAKAHDIAIGALALASRTYPQLTLTLVGDGPLRGEAEALAEKLGVRDKSIFTGVIDSPESLFESHHALLMPSRWEGLPIALLEASAAGLPAIVSNIDAINSVDRGYAWEYFEPNNIKEAAQAMIKMLREYSLLRDHASTVAGDLRSRHSIERTADAYDVAYGSALERLH